MRAIAQPEGSNSLCHEAINLASLVNRLFPDIAELQGLVALMLLQASRQDARVSVKGELILLPDQERAQWNWAQIEQGQQWLDHALALQQSPGTFQLQAAIAALHIDNRQGQHWPEIVLLYNKLVDYTDSAVAKLNRAVALMMNGQLSDADKQITGIRKALTQYHPYYIVRAELYLRQQQVSAAVTDLQHALSLTHNQSEQAYIRHKITQIKG